MFAIDHIILLAAVLILLGIFSSKLSARLGLPVLVLFLLVGMLAGEDGIGISFDNAEGAHALGTLALAMILFDGGLQTSLSSIKRVWKPASLLATIGVLVTATITGLTAALILDLSPLEGMLLGAIVGSTDAAAVFSLLRNAGIHLNPRLKSTLEIESASNDPMAIFLTVGLLDILVNDMTPGIGLLQLFVMQMGIGAAVGLLIGWLAVKVINRIDLTASGLYLVLVTAFGLLAFGIAANLEGSGFLAIFIAGVMIGNKRFVFQRSTFLFHDGLAWLSQIMMFVVLGLLINPESLLDVWFQGLLIAAVLILVARPLAVVPILKYFGFSKPEIGLVSWVGLRGAVPIILAIFPLLFGLPNAPLIFDVVFFVVLISATIQGSTLPWLARKLGLTEPPPAISAATLEITSLGDVDAEIVEYTLGNSPRVDGLLLSQMALPDSTIVAMISRGSNVIPPRGSTRLCAGDHLFVVLRPELRPFVDCIFAESLDSNASELLKTKLNLKGSTRVEDVLRAYGIELSEDRTKTLEQLTREALGSRGETGATVNIRGVQLEIADMLDERLTTISLSIRA
ncbi:potassium/proton antiporter [Marinobacterium lutimaris]|uniref:Potassium/proton antiporter, CPA1 family n=1 Tax=Marinobacterium lutimaris TaxID=568106 RepID=A0A1H5VMZ0_9GAMM|nr:potassium/proton antiporter [Marinobacterium lutimaris]SEF88201.1 potassium/proton antiporter, CPA1 family [Marinobacterium lutimaris]